MKSLLHSWPGPTALVVIVLATLTRPCLAENWQDLGASPVSQTAAPPRSPEASLKGETLLFAPPKNFKIGHHDDRIGSLTEFVPNGQTVEDWTEMLTVQVFRNLKEGDPAAFLQNIGSQWLHACPETPKDTIRSGQVNGYPVSMLVLKCPKSPSAGKPETAVFRVIKGKDALYSVQHAWRTVPSDEAQQALAKSTVCDTRDPSHPCPSFDQSQRP
jgi:hypothetical protein